jgi:hypothetical protein
VAVDHTFSGELPAIVIDVVAGLVGFVLSLGWWKMSGRELDCSAVIFSAKMFGGITLFGMVLAFIM